MSVLRLESDRVFLNFIRFSLDCVLLLYGRLTVRERDGLALNANLDWVTRDCD